MQQNNIPNDIKELVTSPEIFLACEKIGKDLGLHVDQIGELDAQVREILRGKAKSENLLSDLKKYL